MDGINKIKSLDSNIHIGDIDVNLGYENLMKIIRIAEKNQIIIPLAEKLLEKDETLPPKAKEHLKSKLDEYEDFWNETVFFFDYLKNNNFNPLLIKSNRNYKFYTGDINILIKKNEWDDLINLLRNEGGLIHDFFQDPLQYIFEPKKRWITFDELRVVHLHSTISWHGIEYISSEKIFENKKKISLRDRKLYIPSKRDSLLINCAHTLFENFEITFGEYHYCRNLIDDNEIKEKEVLSIAANHGWEKGLKYLIQKINELQNTLSNYPYQYDLTSLKKIWTQNVKHNLKEFNFLNSIRGTWRPYSYYNYKNRF